MRQFVFHMLEDEKMFAIITFRDTGPIKTWSAMKAANVHNARTAPLAHAVPGAPAPEHLIGAGDLVRDAKRLLRGAKLDPDQLRKNGVIAYEAILTASADFFTAGTPAEQAARLSEWKAAQVAWARERYGPHRIASMVLHLDEKTPHIHLVVLPLEVKRDARRTDREMRWSLVGRTISGPGRFDDVQDAYGKAMEPFGLRRGVKGSGRKHEPVLVYLARMAEKERVVDAAADAIERQRGAIVAERDRLAKEREEAAERVRQATAFALRVERDDANRRRLLAEEREAFRREAVAAKAAEEKARAERERIAQADAQRLDAERAELAELRRAAAADRAEAARALVEARTAAKATAARLVVADQRERESAAERNEVRADRQALEDWRDKLEAHRTQMAPVFAAAGEFLHRVEAVKGRPLTPPAEIARVAAVNLEAAAQAARRPATPAVSPGVLAMHAQRQAMRAAGR